MYQPVLLQEASKNNTMTTKFVVVVRLRCAKHFHISSGNGLCRIRQKKNASLFVYNGRHLQKKIYMMYHF